MEARHRSSAAAGVIASAGLLVATLMFGIHDQAGQAPTPPRPPAFDPPTFIVLPQHEPTAVEPRPPSCSAWSLHTRRRRR